MKRTCVLAACGLWLPVFFAFPQSAAPPVHATKVKYEETSRIKLSGVVDDIKQKSLGGTCKAPGIFVSLKVNEQTVELQVGPKWFIDDMTWTFTKGDKLEITGWKIDKDGTEVVVRKISRGEWTLEPRDDTGAANWLWMTAPKDSGKCT